jgi:adenylate kinase family enzyme
MRIVIVGTSGSGKTTLATRLSAALGLERIELDAVAWQPGWNALHLNDPEEFRRRVAEAASGERWVCDGNYRIARDILWPRATHLIWLDYDRPVIMRRVIARSVSRAVNGRELWNGNFEDWRKWLRASHPIRWAWDTWAANRTRNEAEIADPANGHLRVFRLRKPAEARGLEGRLGA